LKNPPTLTDTWWRPLLIACRHGSARSLAIRRAAVCVATRIFGVRFNRLGKFGDRGIEMLLLGELDPALHVVPAAAPRRLLRKRNLSCCNPQK